MAAISRRNLPKKTGNKQTHWENIWKIIVINICQARIELKEQKQKQDPGIERDDTQLKGEGRELQLNLKKNDNGSTNKLQPTCCMLHAANST